MDERLRFIARLLDGEKMAVLCRQFGISRKTGYKILTRYNNSGLEGLPQSPIIFGVPAEALSGGLDAELSLGIAERSAWRHRGATDFSSARPRAEVIHGPAVANGIWRPCRKPFGPI